MQTLPAELARGALDAAPDAMIIIDGAGIVRYVNRQVSVLFGYAHDEIVGQPVEQLIPERFRSRHPGHRAAYGRQLRVRPMGTGLDLFGRRADGSEFPVEISLSPIEDGERRLVAAAIRDVTERKREQAELVVAGQIAAHEREEAQRANSAKSRFLATASHDLRQPLQTLALLNGSLRRTISDREALQAIAHQEQAVGAMSRLLNALLDISKLESGTIQPLSVDFRVSGLFEELQREFERAAQEKGLTLQIQSTDAVAHSDPSLVEQVLRNLVSNAIKYTRRGGVQLRCVNQPAVVRIEIHDSGIGIPEDQLPHIFEEFYQVPVEGHRARDGYGLGLNIVQRIVRLLDLHLDISSEVGRGTVFALSLAPGQVMEVQNSAPGSGPAASAERAVAQHILLVEDDAAVRNATRMLLKVEGYQVTAVASIAEAMRAAESKPVDLLITDYHLQGDEVGTALIVALRQKVGGTLKAVLITGDTSSAVKELPADPNLRIASKPIEADMLLALLTELSRLGTDA